MPLLSVSRVGSGYKKAFNLIKNNPGFSLCSIRRNHFNPMHFSADQTWCFRVWGQSFLQQAFGCEGNQGFTYGNYIQVTQRKTALSCFDHPCGITNHQTMLHMRESQGSHPGDCVFRDFLWPNPKYLTCVS